MRYEFPIDLTLEEVRQAIANHNARTGTNSFIEADRGDIVIFNYVVSFDGAFPAPITEDENLNREYAIIRECRGLTFHKDGRLLNRKFAKFFNVNEKPETQSSEIDWSQPHKIFEKLDGSMITPIWTGDMEDIDGDGIRWCTKMGMTDVAVPVEEFVSKNPHYARWASMQLYSGYTPIFEWCSRQQKIVVDYPEDRLVLLAIRDNRTGLYLSYEQMLAAENSGIEVVRTLDGSIENIEEFMAEAQDLEGAEGYIIRFDDGHMVKVKGAWYVQIHRTKEFLQHEKDVLQLIFQDRLDDAKAFMDNDDRERVERYNADLALAIEAQAVRLYAIANRLDPIDNRPSKKEYVDLVRGLDLQDHEQGILFRIYDGHEPGELVRNIIAKHISTGPRVESVRHLMGGLNWNDYRDSNANVGDD